MREMGVERKGQMPSIYARVSWGVPWRATGSRRRTAQHEKE